MGILEDLFLVLPETINTLNNKQSRELTPIVLESVLELI